MADETTKVTEKVYCYDHPSAYKQDNSAMWAAMMNNQNNPAEMAAMMNGGFGGMGGMQWLVWLYAMRWLGDDRNKDNAQLAALQNQISDNQNINNVTAAIQNNAYKTLISDNKGYTYENKETREKLLVIDAKSLKASSSMPFVWLFFMAAMLCGSPFGDPSDGFIQELKKGGEVIK